MFQMSDMVETMFNLNSFVFRKIIRYFECFKKYSPTKIVLWVI